jgi:hypothetical protein
MYCCRASHDAEQLQVARREVEAAGIDKDALIAATWADEASGRDVARLRAAFPDLDVVPVSILDETSLDALRAAIWTLTGLVRVYLRSDGVVDDVPLPLRPGATVIDVADSVHHDLAATLSGARVWGSSARFDGQRVGGAHAVQDGDIVEILIR